MGQVHGQKYDYRCRLTLLSRAWESAKVHISYSHSFILSCTSSLEFNMRLSFLHMYILFAGLIYGQNSFNGTTTGTTTPSSSSTVSSDSISMTSTTTWTPSTTTPGMASGTTSSTVGSSSGSAQASGVGAPKSLNTTKTKNASVAASTSSTKSMKNMADRIRGLAGTTGILVLAGALVGL
ncbi:hypothetical protein BDR22DRAFT_701461 [Usnea florida]